MIAERILGAALIALGALSAVSAMQLEVPFAADPLGPSPFTAAVAMLLALCGLGMLLRPTDSFTPPERRMAPPLLVLAMLLYALLMLPLGFLLATALMASAVALLFGARTPAALLVGVTTAITLWLLFDKLLDLPLPKGILPL